MSSARCIYATAFTSGEAFGLPLFFTGAGAGATGAGATGAGVPGVGGKVDKEYFFEYLFLN